VYFLARSSDFADQLKIGRFHQLSHDFAFSPISTRRRMASGRPGMSSCLRRQSSNCFAMSGCNRTPTSSPVTSGLFFGVFVLTRVDLFMLTC
jgi:hypothetical protein